MWYVTLCGTFMANNVLLLPIILVHGIHRWILVVLCAMALVVSLIPDHLSWLHRRSLRSGCHLPSHMAAVRHLLQLVDIHYQ